MEIEFGNECKEEQPLKEIAMGFGKFDYETMDSAERSLVRKKRKKNSTGNLRYLATSTIHFASW